MNVELLRELTEAHGVSGQEESVRAIARRELSALGEVSVDPMGNVICLKSGSGHRKLMLAAHMDEIGFVVKHIDKEGFCRLNPIGGWDPRQMNAQRVRVGAKDGSSLPGILMYGTKPAHLLTEAETREGQKHDNFFVDLGMGSESVNQKVRVGAQVTMDRSFSQTGDLFTCKAMDDRVALFVMIEALRKLKGATVDVYAVATVQEEVGLRGAAAAGSAIAPDIMVAIDITLANDIPGVPEQDHTTKLGAGTAIKIMDSSLICHPKLVDHFRVVAERNQIPHQFEILARGGTDAGGVQRLHGGMPAFTLSIPTRYVHTVNETVHPSDVQASIDLLAAYIEDAHNGQYAW